MEDIGFDYRKSRMCERTRFIERLYDKGGMVMIGTKDSKRETAPLTSLENGTNWLSA